MSEFLDSNVCISLRNTVNESNLFNSDDKYKKEYFNLICASMDRLDSSINYLNNNSNYPETEEEFIFFLTYVDMIVESVRNLFKNQNISSQFDKSYIGDDKYTFFGNVEITNPKSLEFQKSGLNNITNKIMQASDIEFFKYVRALSLAHFCGTNRHDKFLIESETQYSPFVLANNKGSFFNGIKDPVGVMVYSNKMDGQFFILFSFKNLKEFTKYIYNLLNLLIEHNKKILNEFDEESKKQKINRTLNYLEILNEINKKLKERYIDLDVDDCIKVLEYKTKNKLNNESVSKLKSVIVSNINLMCDAVDNLDYSELSRLLDITVHLQPKNKYSQLHYQLEKILCWTDENWARIQAKAFSQEFAKKWVAIDSETMSKDEIQLLCRTACYYEAKFQKEN